MLTILTVSWICHCAVGSHGVGGPGVTSAAVLCCCREEGTMAGGLQVRSPAVPVRFLARCSIPCIAAAEQELCPPPWRTVGAPAVPGRGKCHLALDAGPASLPWLPQPLSNAASAAHIQYSVFPHSVAGAFKIHNPKSETRNKTFSPHLRQSSRQSLRQSFGCGCAAPSTLRSSI